MTSAKDLIAELDDLIAASETAETPERSYEHLKKAIQKICVAMHGLVRNLERMASDVLAVHGLSDELDVAFRDRVVSLDVAAPNFFTNREALSEFFAAARPALAYQLSGSGLSDERFSKEVLQSYDDFMEQKISASHIIVQCNRLKAVFCRPPQGGSAQNPDDNTPPLLPNGSRTENSRKVDVHKWLNTGAAIVTAAAAVISIFARDRSEAVAQESKSSLGLLTLLLMLGFSAMLDNTNQLPAGTPVLVQSPAMA